EFGVVLQSLDTSLIVAGYSEKDSSDLAEILVTKLDTNGIVIWDQNYGTPQTDLPFSLAEDMHGDLILGGIQIHSNGTDADSYLQMIISDGVLKWDTIFGSNNIDGGVRVDVNSTGSFIAVAHYTDSVVVQTWDYGKIWLLEFDSLGNTTWEKKLYPNRLGGPSLITNLEDGNSLIVGQYQYLDLNRGTDLAGWVSKITPTGEVIWDTRFVPNPGSGDNGFSYLRGAIQTSDGGFAVCGFTTPSTGQDLWVAKLDSNGCYDPNRNCWVGTEEYSEIPEGTLKMWPNPANDRMWISLPEQPMAGTLRFFSIKGQQLREESISTSDPREVGLTLQDWAPGVYLVRWEPLEGSTMEGKILLEPR
ncbi:MAG: T9SS type A sorting domain-containing protein, partial [Salibacteraceae bacterium]